LSFFIPLPLGHCDFSCPAAFGATLFSGPPHITTHGPSSLFFSFFSSLLSSSQIQKKKKKILFSITCPSIVIKPLLKLVAFGATSFRTLSLSRVRTQALETLVEIKGVFLVQCAPRSQVGNEDHLSLRLFSVFFFKPAAILYLPLQPAAVPLPRIFSISLRLYS
jgi:hypothetical protein